MNIFNNNDFQVFFIESSWIEQNMSRFDSSYYAKDVVNANFIIKELQHKGIKVENLADLIKNIYWPGRFKRNYVSKKKGKPFLMPSEVIHFLPKEKKYIKDCPDGLSVKKNFLLLTRSGSVGRIIPVTNMLEKFILSDDLIRIIPKDELIFYLYAYLNTWVGQALLTKNQYGSTVKHIEPHQVSNIKVPILEDIKNQIIISVKKIIKLREECQNEIQSANEMIYSLLKVNQLDYENIEYIGGEKGKKIRASIIKSDDLRLRLDASFHKPILRLLINELKKGELRNLFRIRTIGDIADVYDLPTYKRIYTKEENGYPIVSGSHLRQTKLYDLKYISPKSFKKGDKCFLDNYRIRKGWILTTERGTIGINTLVTDYWDGWLASHNILRVVPKEINPGFLLAYLNSNFAQIQLKSKELGAVVEVLDPKDMESCLIPVPKKDIQEKIGKTVFSAYNKRDLSNKIERHVIKQFENKLMSLSNFFNE